GERCKRCNGCGNSPGSDTGTNFRLNSGSATTSAEYRYRVPQNLRSNGVSRGGSRGPPQVRGPGRCRPRPRKYGPKKMRKWGAGSDIDRAAAAALRERMKGKQ